MTLLVLFLAAFEKLLNKFPMHTLVNFFNQCGSVFLALVVPIEALVEDGCVPICVHELRGQLDYVNEGCVKNVRRLVDCGGGPAPL